MSVAKDIVGADVTPEMSIVNDQIIPSATHAQYLCPSESVPSVVLSPVEAEYDGQNAVWETVDCSRVIATYFYSSYYSGQVTDERVDLSGRAAAEPVIAQRRKVRF